jgi:hypothetical protein
MNGKTTMKTYTVVTSNEMRKEIEMADKMARGKFELIVVQSTRDIGGMTSDVIRDVALPLAALREPTDVGPIRFNIERMIRSLQKLDAKLASIDSVETFVGEEIRPNWAAQRNSGAQGS